MVDNIGLKNELSTKDSICWITGETLVVTLPEELDHHTVDLIRQESDGCFIEMKIRNVIFDYSKTHFMDSSGIGLVMGRYREVHYLNGNIYIVGVNQRVERLIEISGLYRVAITENNVEDAIRKINCD